MLKYDSLENIEFRKKVDAYNAGQSRVVEAKTQPNVRTEIVQVFLQLAQKSLSDIISTAPEKWKNESLNELNKEIEWVNQERQINRLHVNGSMTLLKMTNVANTVSTTKKNNQEIVVEVGPDELNVGDVGLKNQPGFGENCINFAGRQLKEVENGVKDVVMGPINIVFHPIQTAENLVHAVCHPVETVQNLITFIYEEPTRFFTGLAVNAAAGALIGKIGGGGGSPPPPPGGGAALSNFAAKSNSMIVGTSNSLDVATVGNLGARARAIPKGIVTTSPSFWSKVPATTAMTVSERVIEQSDRKESNVAQISQTELDSYMQQLRSLREANQLNETELQILLAIEQSGAPLELSENFGQFSAEEMALLQAAGISMAELELSNMGLGVEDQRVALR